MLGLRGGGPGRGPAHSRHLPPQSGAWHQAGCPELLRNAPPPTRDGTTAETLRRLTGPGPTAPGLSSSSALSLSSFSPTYDRPDVRRSAVSRVAHTARPKSVKTAIAMPMVLRLKIEDSCAIPPPGKCRGEMNTWVKRLGLKRPALMGGLGQCTGERAVCAIKQPVEPGRIPARCLTNLHRLWNPTSNFRVNFV